MYGFVCNTAQIDGLIANEIRRKEKLIMETTTINQIFPAILAEGKLSYKHN